jgi:tRNA A-37 threonylcarbamoyl transferase component Bud32
MADYVGRTLGPYKLEAALGKGGMATVYRAYQASVKRYVAIKVMAPEIADQADFVERFEREVEVIASLEHPHILPVIDYGTAEGIHYLVMRYIEGGSLEDRIRRKSLSLQECSRLLSQIASALDYAHRRGVIHRDLKPNNVLLDTDENSYLTDFGIARLTGSERKLTATGSVMGTPAYMSPEQALGRPVDARSDIYTLGVVLYEMVLSRLPFSGDTPAALIFQHVYELPTPPKQIKPDLPDAVANVLDRAMAKVPDERYPSAGELADAFAAAVFGRATALPTASGQEVDRTLVGGPQQPIPAGTPVIPPTRVPTPGAGTARAATPPPTIPQSQPTTAEAGGAAAPPRKAPVALIAAIVAVIVLVLGGGGFVLINNANQNATAIAFALSATKTPTITPSFTPTATATVPPTATSTPNATLTAVMATINALQANQTATMLANLVNTARASTAQAQTQVAKTTQTQQALLEQTAEAASLLTATANAAATASAIPTATATRRATVTRAPTATKRANTGNYPAPKDVVANLVSDGGLTRASGSVVLTKDSMDLSADQAGYNYWDRIDKSVTVTDFVLSAEVTWDAPDTANECGLLFRYTEPADDATKRSFYAATISRSGTVQVIVRDKDGYRDGSLVDESSDAVQSEDGAVNRILVIGRGSNFAVYVNGTRVADFKDATYKSGNVGVFISRGKDSTGLTCSFRDIWAYSLAPAMTLEDSLMSDNPDDVIAGLTDAGLVSAGAKLAAQDPAGSVVVQANEKSLARYSAPISRTQFTNFALSTDIVSSGDKSATSTSCGIFYNGKDVPDNLVVVFYTRAQAYSMYLRQDKAWRSGALKTGKNTAIKGAASAKNRFTLVVVDGTATLYINASKMFEATDDTFTSGLIGYYIEKGTGSGQETCSFSNTSIWRLN